MILFQLPGGPRHRKADSMPETFYESDEPLPVVRDITVARSHSDSRKWSPGTYVAEIREGASAEEIEKLRVSENNFVLCFSALKIDFVSFTVRVK